MDQLEAESSADFVGRAALVYVLENLQDRYDTFLDMLLGETEDRWLIQHFIALQLKSYRSEAIYSLFRFLQEAVKAPELYEEYASDCKKFLEKIYPGAKDVEDQFSIYERIITIDDALDKKEKLDLIEQIVDGKRFAPDWIDPYL